MLGIDALSNGTGPNGMGKHSLAYMTFTINVWELGHQKKTDNDFLPLSGDGKWTAIMRLKQSTLYKPSNRRRLRLY